MASLNMYGWYALTDEKIDKTVTVKSAGNYALSNKSGGEFYVDYVGRSDSDLNDRLKDWVDIYKFFQYSYATSPKAAFLKECENYHDFGTNTALDNDIHPDRPDDTNWKCPKCDTYD